MKLIEMLAGGAAFFLVSLAATPALAQCPPSQVVFLFDQSGSMFDPGNTGQSKWQIGLDRALVDYVSLADGAHIAIMGFSNSTIGGTPYLTTLLPFASVVTKHANTDAAIRADLATAAGTILNNTPLAAGACDALSQVWTTNPSCTLQTPRQVYLYSDGLENSTPTTHACYGPNSTTTFNKDLAGTGFGLDAGSWQRKVANMAYNGQPNADFIAHPDQIRPVINVRLLFDFVNHLSADDSAPLSNPNLQADVDANGIAFFKGLTQVSFGTYLEAKKVNGVPTVPTMPGDTNPTPTLSCVDAIDLQRILEAFGRTVTNSDPQYSGEELASRDVNNDLVIDIRDYSLATQHYGACFPAPIN